MPKTLSGAYVKKKKQPEKPKPQVEWVPEWDKEDEEEAEKPEIEA